MLLFLPLSVQIQVLGALRLPLLPLGTPPHLNAEFTQRRWDLFNLCLTSRALHDISAPFLYETIALTSGVSVVHLFSTVLAKQDRRAWIRSIACPTGLTSGINKNLAITLWNKLVATQRGRLLDSRERAALKVAGLSMNHISTEERRLAVAGRQGAFTFRVNESDFCDQIFAAILCLTTRLEELLLQIPQFNGANTNGLDSLHAALEQGTAASDTDFLTCLRSIKIQAPPPKLPCGRYTSSVTVPRRKQAYDSDPMRLPTFEIEAVQNVEFQGDDGLWFSLLRRGIGPWAGDSIPADLRSFRTLRSLKLYESKTSSEYLACLLGEAHSLETFHYTTRRQEWRRESPLDLEESSFVPAHVATIGEALWHIRKTVHELRLGSVEREEDQGPEEYDGLEVIHNLSSFEMLTRLVIDIRWLVRIPADMLQVDLDSAPMGMVPLRSCLPASLKELELNETWTNGDIHWFGTHDEVERRSMAYSQLALWSLLPSGPGHIWENSHRLPNLEMVILRAEEPFHYYPPRPRSIVISPYRNAPDGLSMNDCSGPRFHATPLKTQEGIRAMTEFFRQEGIVFKIEWVRHVVQFDVTQALSDVNAALERVSSSAQGAL